MNLRTTLINCVNVLGIKHTVESKKRVIESVDIAMALPLNVTTAVPSLNDYFTNTTTSNASKLDLPYTICEILVAICAVLGNGLVIIVFMKERKLRRRTNYYIISLATADLLVGLFAIPFAILASIGLPKNFYACLFTVSVLVVLCTISIFCLVAVSVDRYWAILHPMRYSRTVRTKTAIGIICVCWIAGSIVGFLPLVGWNTGNKSDESCIFLNVMDHNYLLFLYFGTIIFPGLLIAAFYAHIYTVVVKQLQQIVTINPGRRPKNGKGGGEKSTSTTMLRLLGAAQRRDVKATQNLSRIVIFFILCWFPLYTVNCVIAVCPEITVNDILMKSCIVLSHFNSVGNPILYAYHLKDFRAELKNYTWQLFYLRGGGKSPNPLSVIQERGSLTGSQRNFQELNVNVSYRGSTPGANETPAGSRKSSSLLKIGNEKKNPRNPISIIRKLSIKNNETIESACGPSQSDKKEICSLYKNYELDEDAETNSLQADCSLSDSVDENESVYHPRDSIVTIEPTSTRESHGDLFFVLKTNGTRYSLNRFEESPSEDEKLENKVTKVEVYLDSLSRQKLSSCNEVVTSLNNCNDSEIG